MASTSVFTVALTRLPFAPLGPTNWRDCRRAIGGYGYGSDVGFSMLSLTHGFGTPERPEPGLSVTVGSQLRSASEADADADRAFRAALRRMTTLNPDASVTVQGRRTWGVQGQELEFELVRLDDGQFFARAIHRSITVTGRDWPLEDLQLVEVDPLMYDRSIGRDEE